MPKPQVARIDTLEPGLWRVSLLDGAASMDCREQGGAVFVFNVVQSGDGSYSRCAREVYREAKRRGFKKIMVLEPRKELKTMLRLLENKKWKVTLVVIERDTDGN